MATLNMNLNLPVVGVTVGPTYAVMNNTAFETIDAHDHTTGKGVQVPSAGININANLQFNSYAAIELSHISLEAQGSAPSTNLSVYVNASNNLYYRNGSGTAVQLTDGGSIASAGSGVITFTSVTTSSYSVSSDDAQSVLGVNTSTAKTINLPPASTEMTFWIKDVTGSAATNNISIVPDGSDTVEGAAATYALNETFTARMLISDGISAWYIL